MNDVILHACLALLEKRISKLPLTEITLYLRVSNMHYDDISGNEIPRRKSVCANRSTCTMRWLTLRARGANPLQGNSLGNK